MEVSKYDKSITHLRIKDLNFRNTVDGILHIGKLDNSIKLGELSNQLRKSCEKLSKIDKEYYIDKGLGMEAVMIVDNVQRVEKIITRFLEDDVPYPKFVSDLKEMTNIVLKNVNASLQVINKHI